MKAFIKENDRIADSFVSEMFPLAEAITNQQKGSAADYILQDGTLLEVKVDKRAIQTGNIFVEFQYTNNTETRPSGIALSAERGYNVLIICLADERVKDIILLMPAKDLIQLAINDKVKVVKTSPYRNGNREGVSASGYLVPLKSLPNEWKIRG